MATLFSGNLDLGNVTLRPGRGQATSGAVTTARNVARLVALRKARGSSPDLPNKVTVPTYDVFLLFPALA